MHFTYDYVKKSMLSKTKSCCEGAYLSDKSLTVAQIDDGIVLPGRMHLGGGVIGKTGYYDHSFLHNAHNWAKPYHYDEDKLIYDDSEAIYLGMFYNVWGHCITDCLSQLWPLFSANAPEYLQKAKYICTTLNDAPLPGNFYRILEILGIHSETLEIIQTPTRFRKIYLPDSSLFIDEKKACRMYTREFTQMIDRIMDSVEADDSASKIYFTRTGIRNRKDFGEDTVERIFRNLGYRIVCPERLSLEAQLAMLKGCQTFAATEGSCSHNAVFLKPGSSIVILRKADYINGYQYCINAMKELNVTYIDANRSHLRVLGEASWAGPFYLCATKELADFAGVQKSGSVKAYLEYVCVILVQNIRAILRKLKSFIKKAIK